MDDLSDIGLRREVREVRAVASNIDHCTRKLLEQHTLRRPGGKAGGGGIERPRRTANRRRRGAANYGLTYQMGAATQSTHTRHRVH
jgi:hypothetical protein